MEIFLNFVTYKYDDNIFVAKSEEFNKYVFGKGETEELAIEDLCEKLNVVNLEARNKLIEESLRVGGDINISCVKYQFKHGK